MGDISENFSRHEFACECECGFDTVDSETLMIAQAMRDAFGRADIISGCRCAAHNATIEGAAPDSQHIYARAFDAAFARGTPEEWAALAEQLGATGIGIYHNRVHVDTRSGAQARW